MRFRRVRRYKGGALGELSRVVNDIAASVERISAGDGIQFIHENNSIRIRAIERATEGGSSTFYNSYFRVINDGGNIGVTDGGTSTTGNCGTVKINGLRADVSAVSVLKTAGSYWVWIHSYIDADGDAYAVILITSTSATPTHTYGGVAYGSQLAGRVIIDEASVMTITQDYLHGGEHTEILIGDCDGGAVVEA